MEDHFSSSEKFIDSSIYHRERETELGEDIINSLDKETESSNCLGHFRKKREEIISFRDSSLQILVLEILLSLIINQG